MTKNTATARASSNIAFIKYWGNTDHNLRLPVNSSISMNLNELHTTTTVTWDQDAHNNTLTINDEQANSSALKRLNNFLDSIKQKYNIHEYAKVVSRNNFPMGAGIASSAAAFAALALATTKAANLDLSTKELSRLARLGSGSASRSIPDGFVEWHKGNDHETSYAETIAPSTHWNLIDIIAIVDTEHKPVGSTQGHKIADTSILQSSRVADANNRLNKCREAILTCSFNDFAEVVELDSNLMHAVMMTSQPPLFYWSPTSLVIMTSVTKWRSDGLNVCYTLDAGSNVHCLCLGHDAEVVENQLKAIPSVIDTRRATTGKGAFLLSDVAVLNSGKSDLG